MYCGLASWFAGRKTLSSRNLLAAYLVARPGLGVQKWSHRRWIKGDTKPLQLSLQEYPGSFWRFCFLKLSPVLQTDIWTSMVLAVQQLTCQLNNIEYNLVGWSEEGVSTDQWNKHPSIPALVLLTCEQFLQLPKFATACQKLVTTVWILTSPPSFAGLLAAQTLDTEFAVFERFYQHCRGTGFSFWVPCEIIETWFGLLLCRVLKLHNMCIWLWWTTFYGAESLLEQHSFNHAKQLAKSLTGTALPLWFDCWCAAGSSFGARSQSLRQCHYSGLSHPYQTGMTLYLSQGIIPKDS